MGSVGKGSAGGATTDSLPATPAPVVAEATEPEIEDSKLIDAVEYDRDRKYQEWDDTAAGGWSYNKDGKTGKEQVDFFTKNSNFDELVSGMSRDERDAFRDWCRGRFMSGQQYQGWDKMSERDKEYTRIYDKILDQATLDKDIVVTRRATAELALGKGHTRGTLEELQAARGSLVTSKGSMSTGAAKEGLTIGSSKNVEYKIHIAAGTKGAGMWIGDSRINGWGPEQREFMTNRDSVFAVGRTRYDKKRDVYVVNMYYVGREKHDYGKAGK